MKKILLAILSLITIACYSQTTGHLRYDSVRMYRMGGNSELLLENATRDSLGFLYNYGNGRTRFEVIREVPGGIKVGGDTINVTSTSGMRLISGGDIVYSGTGNTFNIQAAVYEIGGVIYNSPAGQFTLAASDPTLNRQDVVYLGTDNNFHVLQGTAAIPAAVPQVDGDQLALTSISIPAGSTTPGITTTVIYNENIEGWVWSASATTIDPNNTTNVWIGAISANVTNIVHAGYVELTKSFGSFDVATVDALAFFIKLKMQVPTLSEIWISLWNGTAQLTTEIKVSFNKNNITTYQGVSIPIPAFGVPSSTIINKIRFRWRITGPTNPNYTGWFTDYVHFVDGISNPGTGGVSSVGLSFSGNAFSVGGSPVTSSGILTVTPPGNSGEYIGGDFNRYAFPTILNTVGILDGRAKNANGWTIDGNEGFLQTVDYSFPGVVTSAMKMKWDSTYWDTNLGIGDTLLVPVNDSTNGWKSLIAGSGMTITPSATALTLSATGGLRFAVATEDDVAGEGRDFSLGAHPFTIHSNEGGGTTNRIIFNPSGNLEFQGTNGGDNSNLNVNGTAIALHNSAGFYSITNLVEPSGSTNKMMIWDSVSNVIKVTAIPAGGGGGGTVTDVLGTTDRITSTGGTTPDIDISATFEALLGKVANPLSQFAATTSAQLAGVLSDENGTAGGFVRATSPSITTPTVVGAITTADPAPTGTNPSGTGIIGFTQVFIERSDVTLANVTTDQPIYASSHDVITVQANTTYHFKGRLHTTHNATAHSISMGMIPTTAVVTSINYFTIATVSAVNVQGPAQTTTYITQTASLAINASGSNATESVVFEGEITIGATGGTITPVIKFSADPTGTILVKAGAILYWTAIGNDTFTTQGNAN